jgi:hypothetical protein
MPPQKGRCRCPDGIRKSPGVEDRSDANQKYESILKHQQNIDC